MADEVTELLTDIDISQEAAISPDSNFEQAILQSMKERGVKDLFDADGNEIYPTANRSGAYSRGAASALKGVLTKLRETTIDLGDGKLVQASDLTLKELNSAGVIKALFKPDGLLEKQGLSNYSKADMASYIKSISNYAGLDGIQKLQNTLGKLKESYFHLQEKRSRDIVNLPPNFQKAFIKSLSENTKVDRMSKLFGLLKYTTGLRLEEMGRIALEDIDLNNGTLSIPETKGGYKTTVIFGDVSREILNQIIKEREKSPNTKRKKDGKLFPKGHGTYGSNITDNIADDIARNLGNEHRITVEKDLAGTKPKETGFLMKYLRNNMESMVGDFTLIERKMVTGRARTDEATKYINSGERIEFGKQALRTLESRLVGYSDFISPRAFLSAFGINEEDYVGEVSEAIDSRGLSSGRILASLSRVTQDALSLIPNMGFEEDTFSQDGIKPGYENHPNRLTHPEGKIPDVTEMPNYDAFSRMAVNLASTVQEGMANFKGQLTDLATKFQGMFDELVRRGAISSARTGGGRGGIKDRLRKGQSIVGEDIESDTPPADNTRQINEARATGDKDELKQAILNEADAKNKDADQKLRKLIDLAKDGSEEALEALKSKAGKRIIGGLALAAVAPQAMLGEAGIELAFQAAEAGPAGERPIEDLEDSELFDAMQQRMEAERGIPDKFEEDTEYAVPRGVYFPNMAKADPTAEEFPTEEEYTARPRTREDELMLLEKEASSRYADEMKGFLKRQDTAEREAVSMGLPEEKFQPKRTGFIKEYEDYFERTGESSEEFPTTR